MFTFVKNISRSEEVRKKIVFTLFMILLYRIGTHVFVPFIDRNLLIDLEKQNELFGMMNLFSGGSLKNFSIFAIGIMPYIIASLIIQLMQQDVIPTLTEWAKQGENGRKKTKRLTFISAVLISIVQGYGLTVGFNKMIPGLIPNDTLVTELMITGCLVIGTIILMIMAEMITKKGIGNGMSIIIFAGILAQVPSALNMLYQLYLYQAKDLLFMNSVKLAGIVLTILVILTIVVLFQEAKRKILVQYAQRTPNGKTFQQKTFLPIKLIIGGVTPVIFASSFFVIPSLLSFVWQNNETVMWLSKVLNYTHPVGMGIYALLIFAFSYFYAFIQMDPKKVAENLQKQGSYIPSVRPGAETEEYLGKVIKRLTTVGGLFLVVISLIPMVFAMFTKLPSQVQIGGVSLLIVVSVALETINQIKSKTLSNQYRGFVKEK